MEAILWIALGITACLWVGIIAVPVAVAWRLHRRTSEKLQPGGIHGRACWRRPREF